MKRQAFYRVVLERTDRIRSVVLELPNLIREVLASVADLKRLLEASQRLPCFVEVSGIGAREVLRADDRTTTTEKFPVMMGSGIRFMAKGERHEFKITPYIGGIEELVVTVSPPFVIRDAKVGNRSFTCNDDRYDGEPALQRIPLGKCQLGNQISVEVLYPQDPTTAPKQW
jgi:hypothetical protein